MVVLGGPSAINGNVMTQIEAASGASVTRLAGENRYDTAAEVSAQWAGEPPDTVYLTSGQTFADALAVGPPAGIQDEPVLLAYEDRLAPETATVLQDLAPERIVVLGEPERLSDDVVEEVRPYAGTVQRWFGEDRYETATLVAEQIPVGGDAFLASGENFPDALSGGALAGAEAASLLLTRTAELGAFAAGTLRDRDPSAVRLIGGERALSRVILEAVQALLDG